MLARLWRPPMLGATAFLVILLMQALQHTQMVLMQRWLGPDLKYQGAAAMGLFGAALVYVGVRNNHREVLATWLGLFGGSYVWDGWTEFAWMYYGDHLGVQPQSWASEPTYAVMASSVGVMLSTLAFFFFNRETRCNAFRWLHRTLHMHIGEPTLHYQRNIAAIVAMEVIYVTWFFYLVLLALYDPGIVGDRHPVTYALFFANTAWAIYLLNRLARFSRLTSAIRYAIPTAIIMWNSVELLSKWNTFTEVWLEPEKHVGEMLLILGAFVVATGVIVMFPSKRPDAELQAAE
jgi:hypothetical protein